MSQLYVSSPPDVRFNGSAPPDVTAFAQAPLYSKVLVSLLLLFLLFIAFLGAFLLTLRAKRFSSRDGAASLVSRFPLRHRVTLLTLRARLSAPAPSSAHPNLAGLDKATISQLPTFVYKPAATSAPAEKAQCAVCLREFQENDSGRLLPSCKHTFHTECIDTWLLSHSTCPLCRAQVMADVARATVSTQEQQHHREGGNQGVATSCVREGNAIAATVTAGCPCNVLLQPGDRMRIVFPQRPTSSSLCTTPVSEISVLPQVTINIPQAVQGGTLRVSASVAPSSTRCTSSDATPADMHKDAMV